MLASFPASTVNQKHADLGIPNRFSLTSSRFSASISPPFSIANNGTGTFSASVTGGTVLCTVRYQNGSNGCQFQVQVDVIGGTTSGFASTNAYKGSGGRPQCSGSGSTGVNQETGTFTMQ